MPTSSEPSGNLAAGLSPTVRRVLMAVVAALALSACSGPGKTTTASGTVPPTFIGIQTPDLAMATPRALAADTRDIVAAGAGLVRQPIYWTLTEPQPGQFDFGRVDALMTAAARRRLEVLPMLIATPYWALPRPLAPGIGTGPPADPRQLADFAVTMVHRYGPKGSFWSEHPELPKRPVRSWQVWNEPNLPQYWAGHPDPAAYVRLLRVVGRAIHGADPKAEVVSAGIPNSREGIPFTTWVSRFFAAGGRGTFDAFGLHGYAATPDGVVAAVRETRGLLRAHGEARAPIRLTEFGWADRGPLSAFTVSGRTQAFDVQSTITQLAAQHRTLGLEGIVYFALRDGASAGEANHGWGYFTGLLDGTGARKPAFGAFARTAKHVRR